MSLIAFVIMQALKPDCAYIPVAASYVRGLKLEIPEAKFSSQILSR